MLDYDDITQLVLKMRDEQEAKDKRRNLIIKRSAVSAMSACAAAAAVILCRNNLLPERHNENSTVIPESTITSAENATETTTAVSETESITTVTVSTSAAKNAGTKEAVSRTTAENTAPVTTAETKKNNTSGTALVSETKAVTTALTSVHTQNSTQTSAAIQTTVTVTSENAAATVSTTINYPERSFDMKKIMAFAASLTVMTSAAPFPAASADDPINDLRNAEQIIFTEMDNGTADTDINMDGVFDIKDPFELYAYYYRFDTSEAVTDNILSIADYDGNGTVNANDAELLLKYFIHKGMFRNEYMKPSFYADFDKIKYEDSSEPIYGSANPDAEAELNSEDFDKSAYTPEELDALLAKADEQTIIGYKQIEVKFSDLFVGYFSIFLNDYSDPYNVFCKYVDSGNIDLDINSDGEVTYEDINIYALFEIQKSEKKSIEWNHQWIERTLPFDSDPEGLLALRSPDLVTPITDEEWAKCEEDYFFFTENLKIEQLERYAVQYILERDGRPDDKYFDNDYYTGILEGSEATFFGEVVRNMYDTLYPVDENMILDNEEYHKLINQYCEKIVAGELEVPDANGDGAVNYKDVIIADMYLSDYKNRVAKEDSYIPEKAWEFFENSFDVNENGVCGDICDVMVYQMGVYISIDINNRMTDMPFVDHEGYLKCMKEYQNELKAAKNISGDEIEVETNFSDSDISLLSSNSNIARNGDANCDKGIDLADSVTIMQAIANPAKYPMTATGKFNADVHKTGSGVTLEDALTIQKGLLFGEF